MEAKPDASWVPGRAADLTYSPRRSERQGVDPRVRPVGPGLGVGRIYLL